MKEIQLLNCVFTTFEIDCEMMMIIFMISHMPSEDLARISDLLNFDFTFYISLSNIHAISYRLETLIINKLEFKFKFVSWEACSMPIISENFHFKSQLAHCIFASDVVAVVGCNFFFLFGL